MMTMIIGMSVADAIATLKGLGIERCLEMDHDDTVKGITVGCPFGTHYIANVENDIVVGVREWIWN